MSHKISDFLENNANDKENWERQENIKRKKLIRILSITLVTLIVFIALLVCDILFFKSIVIGVLSGFAAMGAIITLILTLIKFVDRSTL